MAPRSRLRSPAQSFFPQQGGGRWQVSKAGGGFPAWRADGKELFYLGLDSTVMAVEVRTSGTFDVGTPRSLFKAATKSTAGSSYDASPDGQRFLVNTVGEKDPSGQSATLFLNWTAALRR